ncbi:MAG: M23 family metallopeptidase, partial [Streptococcaceae bacterium]|nr:M23 family metallopeptidase [Streptococcaceae bacterium]
ERVSLKEEKTAFQYNFKEAERIYLEKIRPYSSLLESITIARTEFSELKKQVFFLLIEKGQILHELPFQLSYAFLEERAHSEIEIQNWLNAFFATQEKSDSVIQMKFLIDYTATKIARLEELYQRKIGKFHQEKSALEICQETLSQNEKNLQKNVLEQKKIEKDSTAFVKLYLSNKDDLFELTPPLEGNHPISSPFGYRKEVIDGTGEFHNGVDYAAPMGTPVYAAGRGTVLHAGRSKINGNYILLKHENGLISYYVHLSLLHVKTDEVVDQKQLIGKVGSTGASTGPHLHFGISKAFWDEFLDPVEVLPNKQEETSQLKERTFTKEELEIGEFELMNMK